MAADLPWPEGVREPLTLRWDKRTTPLEGLERALYAVADELSGTVEDATDSWLVQIHPAPSAVDAEVLAARLRREVVDQVLRVRIAERTDGIRNLIFALAFSRSGLTEESSVLPAEGELAE